MELEKIIEGLECLTTKQHKCEGCPFNPVPGRAWPYGCGKGQANVVQAAKNVIRAMRPRVLSLNEMAEGEPYWLEPYWLEMRGIPSQYVVCNINDHGDSTYLSFACQHACITLDRASYGRRWRCWSTRPTWEEREAVPWQ